MAILVKNATHMSSSGDMKMSLKLMTWKGSILVECSKGTNLSHFHGADA